MVCGPTRGATYFYNSWANGPVGLTVTYVRLGKITLDSYTTMVCDTVV